MHHSTDQLQKARLYHCSTLQLSSVPRCHVVHLCQMHAQKKVKEPMRYFTGHEALYAYHLQRTDIGTSTLWHLSVTVDDRPMPPPNRSPVALLPHFFFLGGSASKSSSSKSPNSPNSPSS